MGPLVALGREQVNRHLCFADSREKRLRRQLGPVFNVIIQVRFAFITFRIAKNICVISLEAVEEVDLTDMIEQMIADAAVREVTHVGLRQLCIVKILIWLISIPESLFKLKRGIQLLLHDTVAVSLAPKLIVDTSLETSPISFVVVIEGVLGVLIVRDRSQGNAR